MRYATPLSMISGQAIPHHLYADDSQLYISFASEDSAAALNGLQTCLVSIQSRMSTNKLKLNPEKTEFLLIENKRQRSKFLSLFPVELFGVKTNPANLLGILGIIFDNFTFRSHITTVCRSYHPFTISGICGAFTVTLIWIAQNYLQLLLCLVVLNIVIHFCMVSRTLTSPNFNVFRINWPAL